MSSIYADNELFAPIARKLHLKLAMVIRLRLHAPSFLPGLVVKPFADPDGPLAYGRVRLGRFDGQELGQYLRRLPVWHHASEPRRQLHQLWRRPIRTDFLQRRESAFQTG